MELKIAWRNPNPVHTVKRCVKVGTHNLSVIYFVQELIAGADAGQWANVSVLEVDCSGHVEVPMTEITRAIEPEEQEPRVTIQQHAEQTCAKPQSVVSLFGTGTMGSEVSRAVGTD